MRAWCQADRERWRRPPIVGRVAALSALADSIERRVAAAIARTDEVSQAILAKGFHGELVPTEADLAHPEGREYEPISALLERIRKEREAAVPTGERGRGKKSTPETAASPAPSGRWRTLSACAVSALFSPRDRPPTKRAQPPPRAGSSSVVTTPGPRELAVVMVV